jgi:protein-S-isoprenylcysteine O-methyltransferase Ste14
MLGRLRPIIGSVVFFLVAPGVVAGWIPHALSGWRLRPPLLGFVPARLLGGFLVAVGVTCLLDCFARFAILGHGTPAPVAPTRSLVVSGLYRYVRNPMYLAVVSTILGQGMLLGSVALLGYGGVVWLLFHLFVLVYEEPTLRDRFGGSYGAYQARVRRWWPRLAPWSEARVRSGAHGAAESSSDGLDSR